MAMENTLLDEKYALLRNPKTNLWHWIVLLPEANGFAAAFVSSVGHQTPEAAGEAAESYGHTHEERA
jgi:hypothetical protein